MLTAIWGSNGWAAESVSDVSVSLGPTPAWVEEQTIEAVGMSAPAGSPAQILLTDAQDRLTLDASDYYYRIVVKLLNTEGVRQNSEWSVVYSPDFESVTWHTLKITRKGKVLDRLPTTEFKRLQRELGFESKVYSGEITAVTVLDDVRVGDTLEVAYTTHRANPVMKGRMTARHYLGSSYPIRRQSVLVRTAAEDPELAWSYFVPPGTQNLTRDLFSPAALRSGMDVSVVGGERIYRWSADNLPGLIFDKNIAPRAWPYYPMIRCGSFKTWADVAEWAEPLFSQNGTLPDEIKTLAALWQRTLTTPEEQLRAAVDWAQNDIRYFALAIGDHNVRPRPLPEICDSRFGDCKDKSTLLVALLRALGFEAWPVLVNTFWQDRISEHGPGPFAFNHAIVAYLYQEQLQWIDPTLKSQREISPGLWALPPYRLGLILRPDESQLTSIPAKDDREPDIITHDVIAIDAATGDATMISTVTLNGLQADYYRQQMETTTAEEMSSHWFNYMARFYKRLKEIDPPRVDNDPNVNRFVITARYRIPDLLKTDTQQQSLEIYAYGLRALLEPPDTRRRRWPYALTSDRFIRHRIDMDLPFETSLDQNSQVIITDGIEYRVEKGLAGRHFSTVNDLRITGDYVAAARMDVFSDAVDEIIQEMGTSITHPIPVSGVKEPEVL